MLSRGCVAFLASVVEMPTVAPRLENIPIVREFLNVSLGVVEYAAG